MMSFEELCEITRPIAERYGVDRIILFGSMARGDYDFCVRLGKIEDLVELCGFIIDLESVLDATVDVVSERALDEDFTKEILNDGRLVYET